MDAVKTNRGIVILLIVSSITIVGYTGWRMLSPSSRLHPTLNSEAWEEFHTIHRHIEDGVEQAKSLSGQGHHIEAACTLMDLASVQHRLLNDVDNGLRPAVEPSPLELHALLEFTQADMSLRSAYLQLLNARYPNWRGPQEQE